MEGAIKRPISDRCAEDEGCTGEFSTGAGLGFGPILKTALAALSARGCWQVRVNSVARWSWLVVRHEQSPLPEQGWKLHISATVQTADEILLRTLPVLFRESASFKLIGSRRALAELNEGRSGLSQVGKFITVYPNDNAHAVRLARALDEATCGLRGPAIPSDRALRPCGVVHYRYGGFGARYLQTPTGEILAAITTPEGTLIADYRLGVYHAPPWALDPFVDAGITQKRDALPRQIRDRYVVLATLHQSPRSVVDLCLDIQVPRRCVLKRVSDDGSGSFDRLRHEAQSLTRLSPDARFPTPFELFEQGCQLFLAMEDLEGDTIEQTILSLQERSSLPEPDEVVRWGCELAEMLEVIHGKGLIYGDLKASNVLLAPDGHLRLVDFELAQGRDRSSDESCVHGRGTHGYMSPRQAAGHAFEIADDIHGLGAFLYLISTGSEPSRAPDPSALLDRPIALMNPSIRPKLAHVIERCLDPLPERRFSSPREVAMALAETNGVGAESLSPFGSRELSDFEPIARQRARQLARHLGSVICAASTQARGGEVVPWPVSNQFEDAARSPYLNAEGGAVLALAELVAEFDDPAQRSALAEGAHWLAKAPRPLGDPLPGLYVGEAGVGVAELRAGQILSDTALIAAAANRGNSIAGLPHTSPDLFNGTAGRLRFHLWLWQETGDEDQLSHAIDAGNRLLVAAVASAGHVWWKIPAGHGSLSGIAWMGYAHGAAGIADALLDLFEVTHDERFVEAAHGAGRWLAKHARPALNDGSGLNWPTSEGKSSAMAFWCHGAAGVGRFMLHLDQLGIMPMALEHARRAARVAAWGARWSGATQCHGHAGNIEFLLDVYQATGEQVYLREARSLELLLNAFSKKIHDLLYWITDSEISNPGFTTGYSGIATCLLRLAYPETLPHVLSSARFKRPCPT